MTTRASQGILGWQNKMTYVNPFHWQRSDYLNKFNIKLTQTLEQDNYQGSSHAQTHRA